MIKTFTCKVCGKTFSKQTKSYAYYCDDCRKNLRRERALEYAYKSGRIKKPGVGSGGNQYGKNNSQWSNYKGEYSYRNLLKDINECTLCGSTKNLCKHHIDKNRHNNNIDNIIVICRKCHSKLHKLYLNFTINSRIKTSLIQGNSRTDNPEPSQTMEGATTNPDECKDVSTSVLKCEAIER